MSRNFCYICGNKVEQKDSSEWWCGFCGQAYYDGPRPCVELALFNQKGEILLAERAGEPWKGKYDLPGGFMDTNETTEQALWRELKEELSLKPNDITKPQLVCDWLATYPFGKETYNNLIFTFWARLKSSLELTASDDVTSIQFMNIENIDETMLSLPQYYDVLKAAQKLAD